MRTAVVVPVLNEEASVGNLLASLETQSLRPDEIVVVDGGSSDRTVELVRRHQTVTVIEAGSATPGRGRNVGADHTDAEWLAFIDAGIVADRHWLERLVRVAEADPEVDVVFGTYVPVARTVVARLGVLAYLTAPIARGHHGPISDPSIASALVRRSSLLAVGGFPDLRAGEDRILMRRLDGAGVKTARAPEARVHWTIPSTVTGTFRRFRTFSKVNVVAGEQGNWHYGVARIWAVTAAVTAAFTASRRTRSVGLAVPAAMYLARSIRSVDAHRSGRSRAWGLNPFRVAGVAAMVAVVDAATAVGWIEAAISASRRPAEGEGDGF